jgi:hypothetical protein
LASLRDLASFYRELQDQIELNDGEITEDILEALNQCEDDIDSKVDAIAVLISDATMWADRHKADAEESKHMEHVKRNQAKRMKDWIRDNLDAAGIEKAGRKYPHVVRDASMPLFKWNKIGEPIPEEFQKVVPALVKLDVQKCRDAWKAADRSSMFLPDGVSVSRGRFAQAAYRRSKEYTEESTEDE